MKEGKKEGKKSMSILGKKHLTKDPKKKQK